MQRLHHVGNQHLFIDSDEQVQTQRLLLHVFEQLVPIEAIERGVEHIEVGLEGKQIPNPALLIQVAQLITQSDPVHEGQGNVGIQRFAKRQAFQRHILLELGDGIVVGDMDLAFQIPLRHEVDTLQYAMFDHLGNLGLCFGKGIIAIEGDVIVQPKNIWNAVLVAEKSEGSDWLILFEKCMYSGHIFFKGSHIEFMANGQHLQHGGFLLFLPG